MSGAFKVSFPGTSFAAVELEAHTSLSEKLTVQNSPVLFGCRTGICGTCLVKVEGAIPEPDEDEAEVLEVFAEDEPMARLCCQIDLVADVAVEVLG